MDVTKKFNCGYTVYELTGEFDDNDELERIRKAVEKSIVSGKEDVAIDLHNADYINSGLIGFFINWKKLLDQKGKKFCLIEPNIKALEVLNVCGVSQVVTIYKTEVEFMRGA